MRKTGNKLVEQDKMIEAVHCRWGMRPGTCILALYNSEESTMIQSTSERQQCAFQQLPEKENQMKFNSYQLCLINSFSCSNQNS